MNVAVVREHAGRGKGKGVALSYSERTALKYLTQSGRSSWIIDNLVRGRILIRPCDRRPFRNCDKLRAEGEVLDGEGHIGLV